MKPILICIMLLGLFPGTDLLFAQNLKPEAIIAKSIDFYGGDKFNPSDISFVFRSKKYEIHLNEGLYEYKRIFTEDGEQIKDVLNNDGFTRFVDGDESYLAKLRSGSYSSSVNSVVYFALLPYRLKDEAVISQYLGKSSVKGKSYYKIKVTFSENSGGEDFEDVFVYWFDTEDYSMDYLAYSYLETKGPGLRFRKAYNLQTVNGLTFQDYENYKANPLKFKVENLDELFNENKLELLSKIELKQIEVK